MTDDEVNLHNQYFLTISLSSNHLSVCRTALDVHGRLHLRLHDMGNDTWLGYIEDRRRYNENDDIGALYYVIAVIFIYGLSIVMMIASHIRKNKQDCQLRAYLKEMAILRKADRREKLMGRISTLANANKFKAPPKNDDAKEETEGLVRSGSKGTPRIEPKVGSTKHSAHPASARSVGGNTSDDSRSLQLLKKGLGDDDDGARTEEEGATDSVFLPVDFAMEMNRLTPLATPMTTPSATPSPPARHNVKMKTRICFVDEGDIL